jgi:hypothetical protein
MSRAIDVTGLKPSARAEKPPFENMVWFLAALFSWGRTSTIRRKRRRIT